MAERCFIHPERKSLAPCHSCGRHFCEECLTEGEEYYYCREEHCQTLKVQETERLRRLGVAKELDSDLIKQKWKENTRRFYSIMAIPLFLVWALLIAISFSKMIDEKWRFSWWYLLLVPLISLAVCAPWFILVCFFRNIFYKPSWESRISRKLQAGQS